MTSEQIKDLIASKIAGQGNQVDLAGALPTILDEIVNMASPDILTLTWDDDQGKVEPTAEEKAIIAEKVAAGTIMNTPIRYEYPTASGKYVYCGIDSVIEDTKYIYLYVYRGGPTRQEVSYAL